MKINIFLLSLIFSSSAFALNINGKFNSSACQTSEAMIWLSTDHENYKERQLLLHTLVPKDGTFSFYVKPGNYQVRGSDKKGCESFSKVKININDKYLTINLKEKK